MQLDQTSPGSENTSDEELMAAIQCGDTSSLSVLAQRYGQELFSCVQRSLCDHHAAEDVVQDTLLAVLRFAHSYDRSRPLRAWLRVIAVNCARTRLKSDARVTVSSDLPEPERGTDVLGAMEEAEAAAIVRAATWDLDPRSRDALRLCYLDGLTHRDRAAHGPDDRKRERPDPSREGGASPSADGHVRGECRVIGAVPTPVSQHWTRRGGRYSVER